MAGLYKGKTASGNTDKPKGYAGVSPPPKSEFTEEEQRTFLKDFILVKPEFWHMLSYTNRIAYVEKTKNGERFNPGGVVSANPVTINHKDDGIRLQNHMNKIWKSFSTWDVPLSSLVRIYIKTTTVTAIIHADLKAVVAAINTNIQKLAQHIKKLNQRVKELEKT